MDVEIYLRETFSEKKSENSLLIKPSGDDKIFMEIVTCESDKNFITVNLDELKLALRKICAK